MTEATTHRRRKGDLKPNPELWASIGGGDGLTSILTDFYTRVYADDRLNHFFEGVTIQRAIEKQYNFLYQVFTGERVYFGERPRNAHHWMVISDELFDYREELMESCLRRHGLAPDMVAAWRRTEEVFRKQIVKAQAIPKKIRGHAMPLEGYEKMELSVGTLCDGCESEMAPGMEITYHVRTGRGYCGACAPNRPDRKGDEEQPCAQ